MSTDFRIGDTVYDIMNGWGEVKGINPQDPYPISVLFSIIEINFFRDTLVLFFSIPYSASFSKSSFCITGLIFIIGIP